MKRQETARLRAGVAGGGIGKAHLDALKQLPDLFEITAFCDIDRERADAIARDYGIPAALTDFDALVERQDVDIVHICTPSGLHAAQAEATVRAGKHVVCEKPLAGSLAQIDALAELERACGLSVSPIYQYRFGAGLQKFLHLRDRGVLGKFYLATVETHWRRGMDYYAVPWRGRFATELGGCLVTHAIHAHDIVVHALGPVASVHARTATRVMPIETEDCAVISLQMADGGLVALSVTLGAAVQHTRLRLCFERVTVESNTEPYAPDAEPWTFLPADGEAAAAIATALSDFAPAAERYEGQFRGIHAALTQGAPLPVTVADARASVELVTAAYHSARTGATVALPVGTDHPLYRGWV